MPRHLHLTTYAMLSLLLLAPAARSQGNTRNLRIAVVNLAEIFERYYKKAELDASLRAERSKKLEVIQEKAKELDKLKEEVQLFDLGTDARKRTEERLFQKRVEFEVYKKMSQSEFANVQRQYTTTLLEEIRGKIADYAAKNGIDLVLKQEDAELNRGTIEMIQLEIKTRQVLYASHALDITEDILKDMNAGHETSAK